MHWELNSDGERALTGELFSSWRVIRVEIFSRGKHTVEIINDEMIRMIFVDDLVDLIDDRFECNAVDCRV